MDLQEAG